jgi:predicted DNA-binding WGR domain protein
MATAARRFEFNQGTSSKFWEVSLEDRLVRVRFGRIGTEGQRADKKLASPALAAKEHDKLVAEKLKKGYVEVAAASLSFPDATASAMTRTAQELSAERPAALTQAERDLLAEELGRFGVYGKDVPQRALTYILHGKDASILKVIEKVQKDPAVTWGKSPAKIEFLRRVGTRDVSLLLRLAEFYWAATGPIPSWWWPIGLPGGLVHIFVMHATPRVDGTAKPEPPSWLDFSLLAAMLEKAGGAPGELVRSVLVLEVEYWRATRKDATRVVTRQSEGRESSLAKLPGFAENVARHADVVRSVLQDAAIDRRVNALRVLDAYGAAPGPFMGDLVDLAVSSSKVVRNGAATLLKKDPAAAIPRLRGVAAESKAEERSHALALLADIGGPELQPFLEARLTLEPGTRIREQIEQLLGKLVVVPAAQGPQREAIAVATPLGPEVRAALGEYVEAMNRANAETLERAPKASVPPPTTSVQADEIFLRLQDLVVGQQALVEGVRGGWHDPGRRKILARFLEQPSLQPIHLVRALVLFRYVTPGGDYEKKYGLLRECEGIINHFRRKHSASLTLSQLADTFAAVGLDDRMIGRYYLGAGKWYGKAFPWGNDAVAPYFEDRLDMLETAFKPSDTYTDAYRRSVARSRAFEVLAMFPCPPASLRGTLWEIALGTGKKERFVAQTCVERDPQRGPKTVQGLLNRKAEVRAVAAEWLGRQGDAAAAEALTRAIEKETNDSARGAMLTALETLGASIDSYVSRDTLQSEARTGVAANEKTRRALNWLPFGELPRVRWQDTSMEVSPEILEWLVLQSHKLATPDPGALLRRHAASFRADDRQAFGAFVLERWLGEERSGASAIAHRGILAIAAACCDASIVPSVSRYVRQNYGLCMPQCKALLQMLAWIDDPAVVQFLVSIATRFRTKGIQMEARRLLDVIAEERGWSVDELADRSVPTAGFVGNGTLILDYGPRQFVARIAGDGVALFDGNGQAMRSLPEPRGDDDREKARESKEDLADARRELKTTSQLQKSRLYEALCNQRTWVFGDWDRYLNKHPIVGRYCRRLVWSVVGSGPAVLFRSLDDGSLTSLDDRAVTVDVASQIRIAHASLVGPEASSAWAAHLLDYEVEPVFDQFGRRAYRLADEMEEDTELRDFEGYLLQASVLRGKASALGYERGPFEGHMWFELYRKRFDGLALEALIYFTGTRPHEDNVVGLRRLLFASLDPERKSEQAGDLMPLREVPPVLLSECWNDMRSIAESGSGFDEAWKKKVGW